MNKTFLEQLAFDYLCACEKKSPLEPRNVFMDGFRAGRALCAQFLSDNLEEQMYAQAVQKIGEYEVNNGQLN
ncbi:MAG TPA: hypothetical protein VIJ14_01730 [Rhabdochlamydiaceae bacterium]